jgi:predicted anti-sigma-YlaC factor YlaD
MTLPARQQRLITEIDSALRASEPHLASMYAMFARLNQREPVTAEPLAAPRWRRRAPGDAMFEVVLLPVMIMMIILGVLAGGTRSTGGTSASCPGSASSTGQAKSAAQPGATARFLSRTASEQAFSPSPATSDTSGVC